VQGAPLRSAGSYLPGLPPAGALFGSSIAVAGEAIAVGAPGEQDGAGAIYLFDVRSGEQRLRITGHGRERLGSALALAGNDVIAGAPGGYDGADAGAVLVFDAMRGELRLALRNPEPVTGLFGTSVIAFDGDI